MQLRPFHAALALTLLSSTAAAQASNSLDAATRRTIIEAAIAQLDTNYVFPDVAAKMGAAVRDRLKRGAYDSVTDGRAFASLLTEHFRAVSNDKHLRVSYSYERIPDQPSMYGPPDPARREARRRDLMANNCGFVTSEIRADGVGYLKFNMFAPPVFCDSIASRAMNTVADAKALIIDLRDNGGGEPGMVAWVSSYLFDKRTHLNDLWERRSNETREFWTREVPGKKLGGTKPVYVLTSSRTFSGAEEFSYNLKSLKRATIVGEQTGGGAHPTSGIKISDHFMIGVPFARAINPITKTNWEGVGVAPDVRVPASEALDTALRLIAGQSRP